jgi:hypothetical protein
LNLKHVCINASKQVALTLLAISSASTLVAQSSNSTQEKAAQKDITGCMQVTNASEKYACYLRLESEVRAAGATTAITTPAPQPAMPQHVTPQAVTPTTQQANIPATAPTQASANDTLANFGKQSPAAEARVQANADGEQELHDRITALEEREPGRFMITLASGQVWYQSNSQRLRLREGMAVRIYPSPLGGSYRMARDEGDATGFIQIQRIR